MSDDWLELVTELLEAASERGDVDYLEVVKGDLQIRFGRGGATPGEIGTLPTQPTTARVVAPAVASSPAPEPTSSVPVAVGEREGTILVRSPMVGTFYRAPAPGEPPFVEIGSTVDSETTLGLVEAMKIFTAIRADVDGVVEEIFHQNFGFCGVRGTDVSDKAEVEPRRRDQGGHVPTSLDSQPG